MNFLFPDLKVSPYGAAASAALIAWLLFSIRYAYRIRAVQRRAETGVATVVPLFAVGMLAGLAVSRLFWCAANYAEYSLSRPMEILAVYEGGLSMWGLLLGFWAAVCIYAKALMIPRGPAMDAFAPGMLLFVTVMRAAEAFTGQGIGRVITFDFLVNPFTAVFDTYGDARFRVYAFEAAAAMALMVLCACRMRKSLARHTYVPGAAWQFALGSYAVFQIVFESMRDDDYMRYGFVRYSQAIAILLLAALAFASIRKLHKARRLGAGGLWLTLVTLASCALVIYQEFQVDAAEHAEIEYLIMLAGACLLFVPVLVSQKRLEKKKRTAKRRARKANRV